MDDELQCMAYSVSPMVIYYNTDLVDFDKMERRGLDVPAADEDGVRDRWTLAEFAAAAQFASRRGDRRGVWIDPTLQGLAPFIYSGGGAGLRRRPRAHLAGLLRRLAPARR